jgi:two-component system cell cycle sensor histidine kinase/response regulator CckA
MPTPLRALVVEDRPSDIELMTRVLRADDFVPEIVAVETERDYLTNLSRGWDVILSDYSMPQFNATRALSLLQEAGLDIPFLVITGSISEEVAVECMKQGATDYLLKDRLTRLGPAVRRALAEKQMRQQRLEMEAQLRQSQKMEGMGRLAGGIAHDFNNLLTIICGYTEMVLSRLEPESEAVDYLRQVQGATDRARNLTQQILAFSRKQMLETRVINLNAEVSSIESMLRRLIGSDVEIVTHLDPLLGNARADSAQVQQVLLNLVVNARDAMPQGGTLTLQTANIVQDDAAASRRPELPAGEYVMLAVRDTGSGMPPDTLSHAFEPFFTTKSAGQGTGLGLATVFGIVKQHGGHVAAVSEPGRGTVIQIYLPRTHEAYDEPELIPAPRSAGRHSGTILLVEDEDSIRSMIARVIGKEGYRVLEAENARHAEQIASEYSGPIDLLLTDVILPGMRGTELHRRVRANRPSLKVLYISGYSDNVIVEDQDAIPSECFLQKPFRLGDLNQRIDQLLDHP